MSQELRDWQARLKGHFAGLRDRRGGGAPRQAVFGLEHGLDSREIQSLSSAIRHQTATRPPSTDHSLAWIVYSAEFGYRYSGDQYWQSFEEETPGWYENRNRNRNWIRDRFRDFQREFGGAVPSGSWAEQFSIICWPITHAILPKDLQRQLARILYELRHSFSGDLLESPETLGELILAQSWNATSRFQNFAQETQLVGQIAAALLQEAAASSNLIHPATLQRIGDDLDRERRAREWLRDARRFAKERANVRGLGILGRNTTFSANREEARAEISALGIEPRLVLRPTDSLSNDWQVSLEIANLSHLLHRFPRTRDILTGSRCVVAGAAGRPLARGRCLHGAQRVTLSRWPRPDEVLLKFEQTDPQLDYLLRTECLLRPGPLWLFRIASDGLAYELRSLRVRPGERYVLVSSSGSLVPTDDTRSVDLHCDGTVAILLDLPAALTPEWEETLHRLGIRQAKTIEVWPAGLAAVMWDGEGHGEWLASERPCLGISVDHPIDALLVYLSSGIDAPLIVSPITPGEPVFVQLPHLPVGLHRVCVAARTNPEKGVEPLGDLDVVLRIREARPWSTGESAHCPLVVQLEPAEPTLEQIWEGRAEIIVRGPVGRNVNCGISLLERDAQTPMISKQLPPMNLPVSADGWRNHFETHFRKMRKAEESYDAARMCEIIFKADELGMFTLRCEREFIPLRWVLRRNNDGYIVHLLDDSGGDLKPSVTLISFETPTIEDGLELASGYPVSVRGGMYVARLQQLTAGIVVSPVIRSLADFGRAPRIAEEPRSLEAMVRVLAFAKLWGVARLTGGFFSAMRRRDVLLALVFHASRLICGENWASAELAARTDSNGLARLKNAMSKRREEFAIATVLEKECSELAATTCTERVNRLATLAASVHLLSSTSTAKENDVRWLTELAIRLGSNIACVEDWAGSQVRAGLTTLMELPSLARVARFCVLLIEGQLQTPANVREHHTGWEWR